MKHCCINCGHEIEMFNITWEHKNHYPLNESEIPSHDRYGLVMTILHKYCDGNLRCYCNKPEPDIGLIYKGLIR